MGDWVYRAWMSGCILPGCLGVYYLGAWVYSTGVPGCIMPGCLGVTVALVPGCIVRLINDTSKIMVIAKINGNGSKTKKHTGNNINRKLIRFCIIFLISKYCYNLDSKYVHFRFTKIIVNEILKGSA